MNEDLAKRIIKLIWKQVVSETNPWRYAVLSGDDSYVAQAATWENTKLDLTRALFEVVFREAPASEELLTRAMDFLDGGRS